MEARADPQTPVVVSERETRRTCHPHPSALTFEAGAEAHPQLSSQISLLRNKYSIVLRFWVFGFSELPGFRAQMAGDRVSSAHSTMFGFRATLFWLLI